MLSCEPSVGHAYSCGRSEDDFLLKLILKNTSIFYITQSDLGLSVTKTAFYTDKLTLDFKADSKQADCP